MDELWVAGDLVGKVRVEACVELGRIRRRHAIPVLGIAKVVVVDAVEIVVFGVPAKSAENHAHVKPRKRDAVDSGQVLEQRVRQAREQVQVPAKLAVPAPGENKRVSISSVM